MILKLYFFLKFCARGHACSYGEIWICIDRFVSFKSTSRTFGLSVFRWSIRKQPMLWNRIVRQTKSAMDWDLEARFRLRCQENCQLEYRKKVNINVRCLLFWSDQKSNAKNNIDACYHQSSVTSVCVSIETLTNEFTWHLWRK